MSSADRVIKIGTRGSKLALWQANWVKNRLEESASGLTCELEIIKTSGDKILDVPLAAIGGKGLFVKEIEEALSGGRIDLAVHSMKDMPAELPPGLIIGAVPVRETPFDALISRDGVSFSGLPENCRVGTSSLRRAAQLLSLRPDMTIVPLRGNIDTRLAKLDRGEMEAIILAAAGLSRLGLAGAITEHLPEEIMLPAVAQGALCIETREADAFINNIVGRIGHADTRLAVTAERAFLRKLEGGCQIPIAALAKTDNGAISMDGLVADVDGGTIVRGRISGPAGKAATLGIQLAERLLARGADVILKKLNG
ncbi:MAG: hydroxymethylbilane synthase [Thermodesulfobacteriota bacterium]